MEDFFYKFLSIYNNLPDSIKKFLGGLYNSMPKNIRYGSFYHQYKRRIAHFKGLNNINDIFQEQEELLLKLVNYSITNIPFYKNYMECLSSSDIIKLPIINKSLIQERFNEFINPLLSNKKLITNTGGSTGNPMKFFLEKGKSRPKEKAHFDWFWGLYGYIPNSKILMIRGKSLNNGKLIEYNPIDNILNISCYNINESNILEILKQINKFKPAFIHAYPSSLKIITSLLGIYKEKLDVNIKAIFLGSEQLLENDREFFEKFYNSKVASWYGHTERLIHGGNCKYSNEFHFYPFYGFLELLDENNNSITEPGKEGRIIATGFDNFVMPFIRYDTGDLGILSENNECACGFKGKSLKAITGRSQDIIVLSDNTKVTLTAFISGQHIESLTRVRELQIRQIKIGEVEINIVRGSEYTDSDTLSLKNKLLGSINNKLDIKINYVENIPKTSRGKNVFFISEI